MTASDEAREVPPWRVYANGPCVNDSENPRWWWRLPSIDKQFACHDDIFLWVGCGIGCCTAESNELEVIDHPRNDPEAVEIITAAREPASTSTGEQHAHQNTS